MIRMNRFLISSALILLISGSGYSTGNVTSDPDKSGWTKPVVEGQWKFVTAVKVENTPFLSKFSEPQIFPDELPHPLPPYVGPDLIFEKDTMYELKYPESMSDGVTFSLDSGYLVSRSLAHRDPCPIELTNDTLYLYQPYHDRQFIKESYVKTSFNDSIVSILKKEGVNYPELAATWFLIREDSGDDGSEYLLKFPFKIPDSLVISREDLIQATNSKMVYWMSTDGKKKDYFLYYKWGYLHLTPGKWYQGDDPWIHFSRKQTKN